MKKRRITTFLMATVLSLSMLAGCGSSGGSSSASSGGSSSASLESGVLRITQSSGGEIDPGTGEDCTSSIAYANLYDSLVYPNMDNEPTALLAESWETSEDGLTWTFKLREGVLFHDGTELLASDVVYSMNRLLTMGEGFAYMFADYVDSVEATDDYTVVFHLKQSFAPFLSILPRLYILNEDLVRENYQDGDYGEEGDYGKAFLAENDAGSGAYYLTEMRTGDRICLARYEDYFAGWDGKENAPDVVEIIMNTEAATVRTMMNNGEIQMSDQWQTNEAYAALDEIKGVDIGEFVNGQMLYLMMNTAKAPTDDVHVRKALAYLIDYDQVCDSLFPGYVRATSQVPSNVFGVSTDGYDYTYDPAKAEEELKKSEYYDQLVSGEMTVEVEWVSDVPDEEKLALLIQSQAAQIGLTVEVTKVPWATHVENCGSIETTPNCSTCFVSTEYPEAGAMLYTRFHSDTAGTWQQTEWLLSDEVDAEISDALTTMDDDQRAEKYAAILRQAADEVWGIAVAEQSEKHAYVDTLEIPAIERANAGESVATPLGYNYLFRDYVLNY